LERGLVRSLLYDYLLAAGTTVVLVGLVTSIVSRRRPDAPGPGLSPWVWGTALVAILLLSGDDLQRAVRGSNASTYPDQPLRLLQVGMLVTAATAVAVVDTLGVRGGSLLARFGVAPARSLPLLAAVVSVAIVGGALVLAPASTTANDGPTSGTDESDGYIAVDSGGDRPTSIRLEGRTSDGEPAGPDLVLTAITAPGDLRLPTFLGAPPDDDRVFVLERFGTVRVIEDGVLLADPVIDLTESVGAGIDGGLIGLAFHPEFTTNGRMFLHYTDTEDDNRIVEFRLDPATNVVLSGPQVILHVPKPSGFHAGGMLQFGPDGLLYIAIGDGREFGINDTRTLRDPDRVAQDPDQLPGGILRIDVDTGDPYAIPTSNAFDGRPANETFAYGLRNPWRFWIDPEHGVMFIGDPGTVTWEEIDVVGLDTPGVNFGWDTMEGTRCYILRSEFIADCDRTGLTEPILAYRNFKAKHPEITTPGPADTACAVILGAVYRGTAIPSLDGTVLYTDYCSSWIRGFEYVDGQVTAGRVWEPAAGERLGAPISFGVDASGEVYLLTAADGMIYRLAEATG
jgi:glucose/arabinose dehydrogenase